MHIPNTDTVDSFGNGMAVKTATVMPERIRAVHESMALKRLRATMERRECNYVYVAVCIHIDQE